MIYFKSKKPDSMLLISHYIYFDEEKRLRHFGRKNCAFLVMQAFIFRRCIFFRSEGENVLGKGTF